MKAKKFLIIAALIAAPSLHATTFTWSGTTNGAWNVGTAANWSGTTPVFNNTTDLVFNGATPITTYNTWLGDGPRTAKSLSFQGTFTSPLEIRTGDNAAAGRMFTFSSASGPATITVASTINQAVTIGAISGTGVDIGTINLASNLEVTHDGSALLTLRRPINETVAGSTITKTGSGTLVLSAANTFTGDVTVSGGIVRLGNAAALGTAAGNTNVTAGGTLDLNNFKLGAGETVSIAGAGQGGIGALYQSSGNIGDAAAIADGLTLTGDATVGAAAGVRYGVGGTGSLGTSGLFKLTKVGAGQFDLRGDVTVGDIVVNQGVLQAEGTSSYGYEHSLTVNAGGEFRTFNINSVFERPIFLNGGKLGSSGSNAAGDEIYSTITLSGTNTVDASGDNGDKITLSGEINEAAAGASLVITGTQRVVISGNATYTGGTQVNSGRLVANGSFTSGISVAANAILDGEGDSAGNVSLADGSFFNFDGTTAGPIEFFRAANVTATGVVKVTTANPVNGSTVVLRDGNGGLSLANFTLVNAGRGTLALGGAGGNSDLIFNFAAANLEWRGFTNTLWGTQDGLNNFQNLTTAGPDQFYTRDNVSFTNAAPGTVTLSGNILAGNIVFSNTSGNDVALTPSAAQTLDALSLSATASGQVTIGVPIIESTPLTLNGTGSVILTAANTSTGAVTVNSGTLQIGNGGATGSVAVAAITNNGALTVNRTGSLTLSSAVSGSGALNQTGTGTTILTGVNTYTGLTTVGAGILQIGAGATGTVAGDILNNATVDLFRNNAYTYGGAITGSGAINKRDVGAVTLTGTNSYGGGTTLYNGTFVAGDANIGTGGVSFFGNGMLTTWQLTGGVIDNPITFSNGSTNSKIINLAAGVTQAELSGTITFTANGTAGTPGNNRISPLAGGTIIISGKMTGTGTAGYAKRNPGTVVITNTTNDYTGSTNLVDAGTLIVDGKVPGNLYFGEAIDAGGTGAQNGTLGGSGTIGGNLKLQAASRLSPGGASANGVNTDTRATLTVNGNLDATAFGTGAGRIIAQLGALAGPNDHVHVGGIFSIGTGTLGLGDFTFSTPGGLQSGAYTLVSATGGITGTLDAANLTDEIIPGFNGTLSISGNDLVLTVAAAGNPYATWAASFPGLTNTAFGFDFDNDGIPTGLEWILGGNPTISDAASITPVVTGSAAGGLTLAFKREEDSIGVATLTVDYGTALAGWTGSVTVGATTSAPDANGVTVTVDSVPDPDNVTVNIPASNAAGGKLFARIKATLP